MQLSREREFNAHTLTFMGASPSSSESRRGRRLWRFSRGRRQDNGVYMTVCSHFGKQLYLRAYQRPLFMSSPQPSSTRPCTSRYASLSPSLAFFSPFSTSARFSSRIIRRQRVFTVDVYQWSAQRKIHGTATLAGRAPQEMVRGAQVTMPRI